MFQKMNGETIRGNLFPKNVLISHTRPRESAPDNIKNRSTPILKGIPKNCVKSHFMLGIAAYSLITLALVNA